MSSLARSTMGVLVLAVLPLSPATAAPPRKWTDTSGQFSVDAEFVEIKAGEVFLKKADGEVIGVPVAKLSESDRSYLARRPASTPREAADPAAVVRKIAGLLDRRPSTAPATGAEGEAAVSRAEWSALAQSFRQLDVDQDGALAETELKALGREDVWLNLADSDGDGKIVRTEWVQLAQSFSRLDKNKNGTVEPAELASAAETSATRARGTASLPSSMAKLKKDTGPTVWRGRIEGRGEIELTITGNRIVGTEPGGGDMGSGTFTMTGDGKSGNMDAVYTEGRRQGETCLGIYETDGKTLRWCVNNKGQRPQDLSGGRGSWLLVLTKVEK
jgi:uncharacterized protein (TIGR03067 family)